MRQIVLDTETTGFSPSVGHRIVEIGCVELLDRHLTGNTFHVYLNPQRDMDAGAQAVHGITAQFLADKPLFSQIMQEFIEFIADAELIIHNAPFDLRFLDHEIQRVQPSDPGISSRCKITDALRLARAKYPGASNTLDALCDRYNVENTRHGRHGALLDAEILATVYLKMTNQPDRQ